MMRTFEVVTMMALLGAVGMLSSTHAEAAKCTQKDYAGTWAMRMSVPQLCIFTLNSKGVITESQCSYQELTQYRGEISGKIEVSSSCAVSGKLTQTTDGEKSEWSMKAKGGEGNTGLTFTGNAKGGGRTISVNAYRQY